MSAGAAQSPTARDVLAEVAERIGESIEYLRHLQAQSQMAARDLDDAAFLDGATADALLEAVGGIESTLRLIERSTAGMLR